MSKFQFFLRKTNSGRLHYFMWELWAIVGPSEKLLIGHENSGKYTRGSFLILPSQEVFQGFVIASPSEKRRTEVRALIETDSDFRAALTRLMHKEHCHLTIGKEIHVGGPLLLKRVTVVRFITVPDEKEAQKFIEDLSVVAGQLNLHSV